MNLEQVFKAFLATNPKVRHNLVFDWARVAGCNPEQFTSVLKQLIDGGYACLSPDGQTIFAGDKLDEKNPQAIIEQFWDEVDKAVISAQLMMGYGPSVDTPFTVDYFQQAAISTAIYPENAKLSYPILGLIGEVGEIAEKIRLAMFPKENPAKLDLEHQLDAVLKACEMCGKNSELLKKEIRDGKTKKGLPLDWKIEELNQVKARVDAISQPQIDEITKELGDVKWYTAATARDLGKRLSDIARDLIRKLLSRKERGKIQGSGDNR